MLVLRLQLLFTFRLRFPSSKRVIADGIAGTPEAASSVDPLLVIPAYLRGVASCRRFSNESKVKAVPSFCRFFLDHCST